MSSKPFWRLKNPGPAKAVASIVCHYFEWCHKNDSTALLSFKQIEKYILSLERIFKPKTVANKLRALQQAVEFMMHNAKEEDKKKYFKIHKVCFTKAAITYYRIIF